MVMFFLSKYFIIENRNWSNSMLVLSYFILFFSVDRDRKKHFRFIKSYSTSNCDCRVNIFKLSFIVWFSYIYSSNLQLYIYLCIFLFLRSSRQPNTKFKISFFTPYMFESNLTYQWLTSVNWTTDVNNEVFNHSYEILVYINCFLLSLWFVVML